MRARCPASTANLGPGFDVLAIALALYVEVSVESAAEFELSSLGEGADLPRDRNHLAARVALDLLGHDRISITIRSEIPVGRGLGSSAALAAATAAASGSNDPFAVAARFDGHAENAAASVFGGLVAATTVEGRAYAEPLPLDPDLVFALLIPDQELRTEDARAVLPREVAFADAVTNLGHMGLLIAGLADRGRLHAFAGDDRLHQGARAPLFPAAETLLATMRRAGASVSCWSGAGPSLLAICTDEQTAEYVASTGERAMRESNVPGRAVVLRSDTSGATTV
ncbi:MAG: homoserine kinase [Acidimicrobiales bacterium]